MDERRRRIGIEIAERHETYRTWFDSHLPLCRTKESNCVRGASVPIVTGSFRNKRTKRPARRRFGKPPRPQSWCECVHNGLVKSLFLVLCSVVIASVKIALRGGDLEAADLR